MQLYIDWVANDIDSGNTLCPTSQCPLCHRLNHTDSITTHSGTVLSLIPLDNSHLPSSPSADNKLSMGKAAKCYEHSQQICYSLSVSVSIEDPAPTYTSLNLTPWPFVALLFHKSGAFTDGFSSLIQLAQGNWLMSPSVRGFSEKVLSKDQGFTKFAVSFVFYSLSLYNSKNELRCL